MGRSNPAAKFADDTTIVTCSDCGTDKPLSHFYRARGRGGYSDRPMKRCIACYGRRSRQYHVRRWSADADYRAKLKATSRRGMLLRVYGLSETDYRNMLTKQGGGCAICGREAASMRNGKPVKLAVDHDHVTGQVRALLCTPCNVAVGIIENDARRAEIEAYLRRFGRRNSPQKTAT